MKNLCCDWKNMILRWAADLGSTVLKKEITLVSKPKKPLLVYIYEGVFFCIFEFLDNSSWFHRCFRLPLVDLRRPYLIWPAVVFLKDRRHFICVLKMRMFHNVVKTIHFAVAFFVRVQIGSIGYVSLRVIKPHFRVW